MPTLVSLLRNRRLKGRARGGARQLRRAGRRRARALPARPRRGRLGPPARPGDAGADPEPEVGGRARRGARGSRRLPPLQGRSPRSRRLRREQRHADVPARAAIEALALSEARQYFTYLSLHDNLFGSERCPRRVAAGRRRSTEKMQRTLNRIYLLLGADLSVAGHRRGALDAGARRPARRRERVGVPRQHADRTAAQADHAGARRHAARGESPARQRHVARRARATSRNRCSS